jgi:ketosteroid isomerase-like protein
MAPWAQGEHQGHFTPKSASVPRQPKSAGLKKHHVLFVLLVVVLMHLSQLMAKNDDQRGSWAPPIEPPGSVIVTSLSERSASTNPVGKKAEAPAQASTPVAAAAAIPKPAAPVQANGNEAELRHALEQWRQAWRGQDMTQYLGMYASDFAPPKDLSRSAWVQQRTQRITSKKSIQLDIQNLTLQINADQATVRFTQIYQDERLRAIDPKTLQWVWRDGQWQITREFTG